MRRISLAALLAFLLAALLLSAPNTSAHDGLLAARDRVPVTQDARIARLVVAHIHKSGQTHQANSQGPHAIYHTTTYRNTGSPGSCVWYAMSMRPDLYLSGAGSAANLANVARSRGYQVGNLPAVGALVVIQRGVDFAYLPSAQWANSTYGHVAYVLAVYADGSYLMASMDSPTPYVVTDWRGRPGSGISFIYG